MSRPPNSGPPLSNFKPIPGRHRTQKWNVAKQYDYSGDDWGGYDAYDDYGGAQQAPPLASNLQPQPNLPSQLPSQQGRPARQMSFDQVEGDEQRQFSAGQMLYGGNGDRSAGVSPARSAVSATSSGGKKSGEFQRGPGMRPRDFTNPEQAPPPLRPGSRGSPAVSSSPAPGPAGTPPLGSGATFPPRKSSASNGTPAPDVVASASASTAKNEKELPTPPFIRPSDIYKRMAAEQERERRMSEDNTRPSMESLQREIDSPSGLGVWQRPQRPLSSVEEGPGESPPQTANTPASLDSFAQNSNISGSSALPLVGGMSAFGSGWFGAGDSGSDSQVPSSYAQTATPSRSIPLPSYMRATPEPTSSSSSDPAAEILAERTHTTPVSQIGKQPDALPHQPSQGYRSVVNQAFDQSAQTESTLPTRDNSQITLGISRSGSDSTSDISPIMARVPFSQQQDRGTEVPTIVEEHDGVAAATTPSANTSRKPTPVQSRSASAERNASIAAAGAVAIGAAAVGVAAGYRRSYDPPGSNNSPAHVPEVQTAEKRLSDGLVAESAAVPSAPESLNPPVSSMDTPAIDEGENKGAEESFTQPLEDVTNQPGRARAGTDYSVRESDIAAAVSNTGSSSEPQMSPAEAAREEQAEQNHFLQTHTPTASNGSLPLLDTARTASPVASPSSGTPVKSRVREIADRYQGLHEASRRDSQISPTGSAKSTSTWSRMDSEENFTVVKPGGSFSNPGPPSRQDTGSTWDTSASDGNEVVPEIVSSSPTDLTAEEDNTTLRPDMNREASFRPQLPGGWVSYQDTPTPASEDDAGGELLPATTYSQATPRASRDGRRPAPEEVDLTPTTKAVPFVTSAQPSTGSHFDQARDAGTALGAALLASSVGGHMTRDFGSSEPAAPVDQTETRAKPRTGELGYLQPPNRPELARGDTEATDVTEMNSAASSVPPTPPAKDAARNSDYYFTVTPLRTGRSRETSPNKLETSQSNPATRPGVSPAMSTWNRPTDTESDRLRKEIVRSLDPVLSKEDAEEDAELTQDALDAPVNAERVEHGKEALPPAEMTGLSRPGLLGQRFSWENDLDPVAVGAAGIAGTVAVAGVAAYETSNDGRTSVDKSLPAPPIVKEPEPEESPEIKPEMPYERPRSRGLHIMNADEESDDDEKPADYLTSRAGLSVPTTSSGPVSPVSKSQENLHMDNMLDSTRDGAEGLSAPSPVTDSRADSFRLPSYYMLDIPGLEQSISQEDAAASAPELIPEEVPPTTPAKDMPTFTKDIPSQALDTDVTPQAARTSMPSPTSPTSPSSKQKIPPFREILAIKSSHDRIKTYDDTRQTFADMNTGLSDWLSTMLSQHPEHASLSTSRGGNGYNEAAAALGNLKGHKSTPSLAKFTRNFSGTTTGNSPSGDYQPGAQPVNQRTPTKEYGGDMDKLQQRGKDLMKNASVLGGKAGASAKGLLAKGKSRFGSTRDSRGGSKELATPSSPANDTPSTIVPLVLDRSESDTVVQPVQSQSASTPLFTPTLDTPVSRSASNRSSNPLSLTLSRLRSRSRSKSTSRSRPTSLILLTSEFGGVERAASRASEAEERERLERSRTRESAVSPWEEPSSGFDNYIDHGRDGEKNFAGPPKRLGILPSPTTLTFACGDELDSPPRRVSEDAPPLPVLDGENKALSSAMGMAGSGVSTEPPDPSIESAREGLSQGDEEEDDDELYTSTPRASKSSATFAGADEGVASLDESTPKPLQGELLSSTTRDAMPMGSREPAGIQQGAVVDKDTEAGTGRMISHSRDGVAVVAAGAAAGTAIIASAALRHAEKQSTSEYVDARSQISAEERSQDLAAGDPTVQPETTLRRSPVSSLGGSQRKHVMGQPREGKSSPTAMPTRNLPADSTGGVSPIPPSQTVSNPVGSISPIPASEMTGGASSSQASLPPDAEVNVANRTYLSKPAEMPRQMSYEPLRRDARGAPVQEVLPMSSNQNVGMDPEDEWAAATAFNTTTLTRHRKVSGPTPERKGKRMSGLYAGNDTIAAPSRSMDAESESVVAPQSRQTSGHFVEDAAALRPDERVQEQVPTRAPVQQDPIYQPVSEPLRSSLPVPGPTMVVRDDEKQARRKSGILDAFRRSPSNSREAQVAAPPRARDVYYGGPQPAATFPRANPQQDKPQRASTTATESDKKKKRFSGLGSLFGRSSTTGHRSETPKKLTKSKGHDPRSGTTTQWPESSDSSFMQANTPPQYGWYAPTDDPPYEPGFQRYPPTQQIYPDARPAGRGNGTDSNIPEAFRPTDASLGRYVRPVGPPESGNSAGRFSYEQTPYQQDSDRFRNDMQGRPMSYQQGQYANDERYESRSPPDGKPSYGTGDDRLSPQISGRSDWERSTQPMRNTPTTRSPTQTRYSAEDHTPSRHNYQNLRSPPAQPYENASTPMDPSISPSGGAPVSSRASYLARQQRRPRLSDATNPVLVDRYNYQPSPAYATRQAADYSQVPRHVQPPTPTEYGQAVSTDDPELHARLSHEGSYLSRRQPRASSMQQNVPLAKTSTPPSVIRDGLGWRQHSEEEETVQMRGVSYPGQEWAPDSWE